MRMKTRKPDFITILAAIVVVGVIVTMMTQAGAESNFVDNKVQNKSLYQDAWSKINNKMSQRLSAR